jgi:valyl-tRNA synthetase
VRTPLFDVEVPVVAHELAQPDKGSGIAMICTFGDTTDVTWWRELDLPVRSVLGRDGRFLPEPPAGVGHPYGELAGKNVKQAQKRVVELLAESGELSASPKPISHPVKFYEKGDRPLEIVTSRQWYVRNGGRDADLRDALVARGKELDWHPGFMRSRYENWVGGLNGDWLISRQRFFGVAFPLWYRWTTPASPTTTPRCCRARTRSPIDPTSDVPDGYTADQRGVPGGFAADPDVMDTWATSSLSPQIAGGWEDDPDLFGRVFPYDLRPAGARHHPHLAVLDGGAQPLRARERAVDRHRAQRLDPRPRPQEDEQEQGQRRHADGAARAARQRRRPLLGRRRAPRHRHRLRRGADEGRRRLAVKLLNAQQVRAGLPGRSRRAGHRAARPRAARAARRRRRRGDEGVREVGLLAALEVTEQFFWSFCDDYIELVKGRAYGEGPEAESASRALRTALDVLLRLFAPVLPFATEEVWSWWREGSVHAQSWPGRRRLRPEGDVDAGAAGARGRRAGRGAQGQERAKTSQRTPVLRLVITGDAATYASVERDLRNAAVVTGEVTYRRRDRRRARCRSRCELG